MQRVEDACRLAMRVNRPNIGVGFSLFDWLAVGGDGARLGDRLKLATPKLAHVSVSGASRQPDGAWRAEPIGQGELDPGSFIKALRLTGYAGPVELWSSNTIDGAPAFLEHVRSSMAAWRRLVAR